MNLTANRRIHGEARNPKRPTKEYQAWQQMKARCYNPSRKDYHRYGGRGIKVCDEWRNNYQQFLEDVGRAPSPEHTLGRKRNNENYQPDNVRWETRSQQAYNRGDVTNEFDEA